MFRRRTTSDATARKREIKTWVTEALALPEDATVMVTELACKEPGCPPLETVIAVLRGPGNTAQFKVHRVVIDIDKRIVLDLVHGAGARANEDDSDVPPLDVSDGSDELS